MYIIFEMKDQRTLGPIQIIGRYMEFAILVYLKSRTPQDMDT